MWNERGGSGRRPASTLNEGDIMQVRTAGSTRCVLLACAALLLLCRPDAAVAQACRPVSHAQLEALLPVLPGFSRGRPNGETDSREAVSRTTIDYEDRAGGAAVISVELMDSCRNPNMLSEIRQFLKTGPPATRGTVFRSVAFGK